MDALVAENLDAELRASPPAATWPGPPAFRDPPHDVPDPEAAHQIECPTLFLGGTHGTPSDIDDPRALWRRWCRRLDGATIDSGHFIAEENPAALLAHAVPFLLATSDIRP